MKKNELKFLKNLYIAELLLQEETAKDLRKLLEKHDPYDTFDLSNKSRKIRADVDILNRVLDEAGARARKLRREWYDYIYGVKKK